MSLCHRSVRFDLEPFVYVFMFRLSIEVLISLEYSHAEWFMYFSLLTTRY